MTIEKRINAFEELGIFITNHLNKAELPGFSDLHEEMEKAIGLSFIYNGWFTRENVVMAFEGIASMLNKEELQQFAKGVNGKGGKKIAVIMAGNIPAVGFHDLLCVLLSGNSILIKNSSEDNLLIPVMCKVLTKVEPELSNQIEFAEGKIKGFEAVIATGNNNSARYFDYYFSKYPHIIRRNRNSVAVLTGNETTEDLKALGKDIFSYFGLGCRNVSHLLVPEGYNFNLFFESIFPYAYVSDNKKYGNNYDYHRALFLLESIQFLDNNFMILKQDNSFSSPVSVIHHQTYKSEADLLDILNQNEQKIQCIVSGAPLKGLQTVTFGQSQMPGLADFADKVNTLEFLNALG